MTVSQAMGGRRAVWLTAALPATAFVFVLTLVIATRHALLATVAIATVAVVAGTAAFLSMRTFTERGDARRSVEIELRRSELRFRSLYDSSLVGICFWDAGGSVTEANDAFLRMFGVRHASAAGLGGILGQAPNVAVEVEFTRADGAPLFAIVTTAELEAPAGNIAHFIDVTERTLARRALQTASEVLAGRVTALEGAEAKSIVEGASQRRQIEMLATRLAASNEEADTFCYSVSHDLRAPLRAIDGFTRELAASYSDRLDESGRRYLARVRAATERMSLLIDDLLALSRLSRQAICRQTVDVTRIAEEIAHETPDVTFRIEAGMTVYADPHLLRIVLENLIRNAVKFSSRQPQRLIEVLTLPGKRIAVRDNGVGFDTRFLDRIFAPFQRLHPSEFEGTGVGLAIVRKIVTRHGGDVTASSVPGEGATFHFTMEESAA